MEFLRQVMTMVLSFAYLKPAEAVKRNCQVEIANTEAGFLRYDRITDQYLDFTTPLRSALQCLNAGKTLASHHKLTQLEDQPCCRMMAERISSSYSLWILKRPIIDYQYYYLVKWTTCVKIKVIWTFRIEQVTNYNFQDWKHILPIWIPKVLLSSANHV